MDSIGSVRYDVGRLSRGVDAVAGDVTGRGDGLLQEILVMMVRTSSYTRNCNTICLKLKFELKSQVTRRLFAKYSLTLQFFLT